MVILLHKLRRLLKPGSLFLFSLFGFREDGSLLVGLPRSTLVVRLPRLTLAVRLLG